MKGRIFLVVLILLLCFSTVRAGESGKLRALRQRAEQVIRQKNDFISQVLTANKISHERNAQGAVVRINVDGRWLDVRSVEVVPVPRDDPGGDPKIAAHELLFYTAKGTLGLRSELTVR